jgi:type VI secretion system protein VasD
MNRSWKPHSPEAVASRAVADRCSLPPRLFGSLLLIMALGLAALGGCKSAPAPSPPSMTRVAGSVVASEGLNRSVSQRPSPLSMRVYELRSMAAFNQADFMSLYRSDVSALGLDLVAKEEFVLQPGESRPVLKVLAPETRFLGVVAIYRDLEKATWRTVVHIQPAKSQSLLIRADDLAVSAIVH